MSKGIHILATIYTNKMLTNHKSYSLMIEKSIKQAGLTYINEGYHIFEGKGFTSSVLLAESHVAIHTWPELSLAYVDIFVCNHTKTLSNNAEAIFEDICKHFKCRKYDFKIMER